MSNEMNIPGFVDLQVNGFMNVDFSAPGLTEESFCESCRALLKRGTVAFLPTVVTSSMELYRRNLQIMAKCMEMGEFARKLPGFHIEGPFISREPGAVGAHNPDWVISPDKDTLKQMQEWAGGRIKLLTIAAEGEAAADLCRYATECAICVSLGHQMASADDISRLADAGAKSLTHLGNGIPNQLHRHENPVWAGLADERLSAMLITDGHHLPRPVLKSMVRAKGVEKTIVVSDASPIAGMPPGTYETLGNTAVLEESGLLHNPQKKCLVGSSATMLECMNHLAGTGLLTLEEMEQAAFHNPLQLISMSEKDINAEKRVKWNNSAREFEL